MKVSDGRQEVTQILLMVKSLDVADAAKAI